MFSLFQKLLHLLNRQLAPHQPLNHSILPYVARIFPNTTNSLLVIEPYQLKG